MLALPPPLGPGDRVAVVAPSSPFPREELLRGLAWLRHRYQLRIDAGIFSRDAFLAGSDERRADELVRAMTDPEVKAIVAARGGYGALRVVDALPWDELARRPKWIVGFSDVTVLHAMAWRAGVASVHGPNVTGLGRDISPAARARWLASIERPRAPHAWRGLRVVRPGAARGVVVGGNLSLVHAMAAAGRLFVPAGAVLALEDVTEAPYRIDRMLTSLRLGGHLGHVSALVFGGFDRCAPGADGRTADEVIEERTGDLGVPVLAGAPFGHGQRNDAFVLGSMASLEHGSVLFSCD
ncbi:MAG TPA: LD-carboxypeptidase [Polyangiaceae bacterium]|jgi:muramoyltetrapeptide carboxypeptidase